MMRFRVRLGVLNFAREAELPAKKVARVRALFEKKERLEVELRSRRAPPREN